MASVSPTQPSYVPEGFELRGRTRSEGIRVLRNDPAQSAFVYTLGWEQEDWAYPLMIFIGSTPPGHLVATEDRSGELVELGVPGVTAVYHDGIWAPGNGDDERIFGATVIHWERAMAHSITASSDKGVVAVRGPKRRGVDFAELVRVARSAWG